MQCSHFITSAASLLILAVAASAQEIGAGNNIPNEEFDGTGGRINVDLSTPLTLPAGSYTATLFKYDAGVAGDVVPLPRDR